MLRDNCEMGYFLHGCKINYTTYVEMIFNVKLIYKIVRTTQSGSTRQIKSQMSFQYQK